ncbi:hypothetical protein G6F43_006536 [Rhizopus delemar]|nr:hypothetical protein G6F43_006536 [Rhizopus delemar]
METVKGRVRCLHCDEFFSTKGKRDTHVRNEHNNHLMVDGLLVERTLHGNTIGFACPKCPKISKNIRTFGTHLDRHRITYTVPSNAPNSTHSASRSTSSASRSTSSASISTHSASRSTSSAPRSTSSAPRSTSSASISTTPTPSPSTPIPAYTSPNDYLKSIVIKAPIETLLFEQLDIAQQFYLFQKKAKRLALQAPLMIEECTQHILALSSIFLLKPGRIHSDMYEFIDRATCSRFRASILQEHGIGQHAFPQAIKNKLEDIISIMVNESTRLPASRAIMMLMSGDTMTPFNRTLLSVRNMVEKLPEDCLDGGPMETELITRYLEASLAPLFENLGNEIMFRWTSVSDEKAISDEKPDAIISIIDGASFGRTIAYGEVKPEVQAVNHNLVNKDLDRLGRLAKGAIDTNGTTLAFAFLVVGNHVTFYLVHRHQSMYLMPEIGHVQLPMSVKEIPLYLAQINVITNVIAAFDKVVASPSHGFIDHPPTLSTDQLRCVIDFTTNRKRKSISSHYRH